MALTIVRVLGLVSIALYLIPTGAHLFELPGKMMMSPNNYMVVQRIYTGWALFGLVIFAAMLLTLLHAIMLRRERASLALSLGALLCLVTTQVIFWLFTYPMNVASQNWTVTPEPFEAARHQWEYSHAASALLTFAALVLFAVASSGREQRAVLR